MNSNNFTVDRALSTSLMQMQVDMVDIPEDLLEQVSAEFGEQVLTVVNEMSLREQQLSTELTGAIVPIARLEDGSCRWLDPRLVGLLAYEFGLDIQHQVAPICSLLSQFAKFIGDNGGTWRGKFGDAVYSARSGELALVIKRTEFDQDFKPLCQTL